MLCERVLRQHSFLLGGLILLRLHGEGAVPREHLPLSLEPAKLLDDLCLSGEHWALRQSPGYICGVG